MVVHVWLVLPRLWPAGLGLRLAGESAYAGVAGDAPLLIARPPNLAGPSAPADVAAVVPGGPAAGGGAEGRSRVTAPRSSGARGPATSFHAIIVLPALGVTYAVVVHRVLGPRMALRRSLQYALARRTLALAASLPALLLVWSLVRRRHEALANIVSGAPAFYLGLLALTIAALRYRERAGQWLDARFFRSEYDARRVLLSLAGRVRFETDPAELTDLVLHEVEQALHPRWMGFLAGGLDPRTSCRSPRVAVPRRRSSPAAGWRRC